VTEPLDNPDVVIRRTRFTRERRPIRLFALCTTAAEEWAAVNAQAVPRLARSLIVAKADVGAMVAAMEAGGLIVRALVEDIDPYTVIERI